MNYHAYMKQNRFSSPIAAAVLSLLGFIASAQLAFGQTAPAPKLKAPSDSVAPIVNNSAMDAETFYKILLAELNLLDEEPRISYALMLDSARKTKDALLFERAIAIALQARSGDSALSAARAWLVAIPSSTDAARYMVQLSISMNRLELPAGKADLAIALEVSRLALAKNPSDDEAAQLAIALMTAKELAAESLIKQYLSNTTVQPKPEVRLAYARTLVTLTRFADALTQVQKLSADSPTYAPSWLVLGTLQYQMSQDTTDKAKANTLAQTAQASLNTFIQLTDPLPAAQRSASQSRAYLLLANMAKGDKKYQQAYDTLSKAIENSNEADRVDLQYDLAMMAEKLERMDDMERILRQVIESRPDDPQAYNALGYSLADRNLRLTEAKELLQKAVKLAPKDPFIADSLGWVEFRLGNLTEAQRILEAAYTSKPDAEIAAHLGEVLWKQGLKDRATAIWKEGLKINKNNDTLLETLKRFSVKF